MNSRADMPRTSGDWARMEKEMAEWGRKLDELRLKADRVGQDLVNDLERRYHAVQREAETLRQRSEQELREMRKKSEAAVTEATKQAGESQKSFSGAAKDAQKAAARQTEKLGEQMKETSKSLKEGAGDVGEGFGRAWMELRKGFEEAYARLK